MDRPRRDSLSKDVVKSHGELLEEVRALRAEVAALRGLGSADLSLAAERPAHAVEGHDQGHGPGHGPGHGAANGADAQLREALRSVHQTEQRFAAALDAV